MAKVKKYEYREVEVHSHLGTMFVWERRELGKTKSYDWEVLSPDYWKKLNKEHNIPMRFVEND